MVYDAAQAAATGETPFRDLLAADPRVTDHLSTDAIADLLDPTQYTGLCAEMAVSQAGRAREVARDIRREIGI